MRIILKTFKRNDQIVNDKLRYFRLTSITLEELKRIGWDKDNGKHYDMYFNKKTKRLEIGLAN